MIDSAPAPSAAALSYEEVLQHIDIPAGQRFVSISRAEGKFIQRWIRDHGLSRTLEIGLGYGASSAAIMSAHTGTHISIDPFQEKDYHNQGLTNLETLGYRDRLTFYEDYSHNVLPKLAAGKQRCDFIFIDGDHRFDRLFVDFYYADLLLADGGYLLLHDAWMRSTQLIASFIGANRRNYKLVRWAGLNLILFQKSRRSPTPWDHFREFYTLRGIVSHAVISRLIRLWGRGS